MHGLEARHAGHPHAHQILPGILLAACSCTTTGCTGISSLSTLVLSKGCTALQAGNPGGRASACPSSSLLSWRPRVKKGRAGTGR